MSPYWRFFLPGYLLTLPHSLVGLVLLPLYRVRAARWHNGCLELVAGTKDGETRILGKPAAQTHGFVIWYAEKEDWDDAGLRIHERCHVVQGFLMGPLFPVAYALCFTWNFFHHFDWKKAYYAIPFEKQAYARQGAFVSRRLRDLWGA